MRQCLIVCTNDATTSEHFGLVLHLLTLFAVCVCVCVFTILRVEVDEKKKTSCLMKEA